MLILTFMQHLKAEGSARNPLIFACFAVRHVQENVQQPPGVEGHQGTPGSPAAPMGTSENPCDMADASAEDQAELVS